jgi:hypothetical protein
MSHTHYIKDELEPLLADLASCFANQTNDNPAMSVRTTEMIRQAYITICAYRLELEFSSSLLCQQQLAADAIVEQIATFCDHEEYEELGQLVREKFKGKFLLSAQPNGGLMEERYLTLRSYLDSRLTRDDHWKKASDALAALSEPRT